MTAALPCSLQSRSIRPIWYVVVALSLAVTTGHALARAAEPGKPARLLAVTVTNGFRHGSINTAEPMLEELGRTSGLYHLDFLRTHDSLWCLGEKE